MPGADFFAPRFVGHQLEVPALQHGTRLVDRATGELRPTWGPQFPDQDDIEIAIQRIGNDPRHRHRTAWNAPYEWVVSAVAGEAAGKFHSWFPTVLEAHDRDLLGAHYRTSNQTASAPGSRAGSRLSSHGLARGVHLKDRTGEAEAAFRDESLSVCVSA